MTSALAEVLREVLLGHARRFSQTEHMRAVLGGIPLETLRVLFDGLTHGDGSKWQPAGGNPVPVFLVTSEPQAGGGEPSRECNWDYALAVRNSFPGFLLLVDPQSWDDRTYSIINATETIGSPLPPVTRRVPSLRRWNRFYADVVEKTADSIGVRAADVESAIKEALEDLPSLDPANQHRMPWRIVDRIARLAGTGHAVTKNELARQCGLPPSGGDRSFIQTKKTLKLLAKTLEDAGIEEGIQDLQATKRGSDLHQELDDLERHLRTNAGSASAFARAPSFYYSDPGQEPSWWKALTAEVIDDMLAEMGRSRRPDKISLRCANSLNPDPSQGEPSLVKGEVVLEAEHPDGTFQSLQFSRGPGRNPTVLKSTGARQGQVTYEDASPPLHRAAITYRVEAHGASEASVQVISMASYSPGAFITCPGASKVTKPKWVGAAQRWQQQVTFQGGGPKRLRVFCAPTVTKVRITGGPQFNSEVHVSEGSAEERIVLDEDVDMTLDLVAADGQAVSTLLVAFVLDQDERDTVPSRFDALVQAHQGMKSTIPAVRYRDSWLRRAEEELLTKASSWKPILATPGWSESPPRLGETGLIGTLRPQVDPRRTIDTPSAFINARSKVAGLFNPASVSLPEADLTNEETKRFAVDYLRSYREWSESASAEACWIDTIALLEREPEQYGSQAFASYEPVAVLVSPLHPIRFGWHVASQRILSSSLKEPCPLAGLLDPHRNPDVLSLALTRGGGEPTWKPYVAISCRDSLWGLYWDAGRLGGFRQHPAIRELFRAGVVPRGIQSGFTASQAGRTLDEINHVLPTRAVLRLGIVGSGQGNTSSTDGVAKWSRDKYDTESKGLNVPRSIEVFDSREPGSQPYSEEISSLAHDTGHNVRWFTHSEAPPTKDLVIIDHLGLVNPVGESHPWRSPATEGSLLRSRIRLDRNNADFVIESRAGSPVRSEDPLLDELGQAIAHVERIAATLGQCSHIGFMPNREVLNGELQTTRFLAVSSTEIDPACFARTTPQAGGFLWDFDLPHAMAPGEQRSGFYLLAKPPGALKEAVLRATRLVSQSDIDLEALLHETSRRGIPILKRLAAGGSLARGELGMLLAVRLLQDAFRGQGTRVRLPVCEDSTIRMVLPVDPYVSPLRNIRKGLRKASFPLEKDATRCDLLLALVRVDADQATSVHLVPVEVKFREGTMSESDKRASLAQASNLGDLLHYLLARTPVSELWKVCGLGLLSEILDYGFRVYGDPDITGKSPDEWVRLHQACLDDVAGGKARITVAQEGRLLVFDESPLSRVEDLDGDGFDETLIVSRADSRALVEDDAHISEIGDQVESLLHLSAPGTTTTSTPRTNGQAEQQADIPGDPGPTSSQQPTEPDSSPASVTTPGVVPPEAREHVAGAFEGFIGNQPAVDTLKRALLKAWLSKPPQLPASYLFTGNPSTGKTELARRVARSLGLPFVSLDGRGLTNRERLFELIDTKLLDHGQEAMEVGIQYQKPELLYPPLVVFIDEVHLVPRPVQESLLTVLEPKDRSVLLADRVAKVPKATFLFATTRPSMVDMPFRTRCTEVSLQDYTEAEVAAIVGLHHPDWPTAIGLRIARLGRLVPRIALEVATELTDEALVSEHQDRDLDQHLDEVRRTRQVDDNGLGPTDIEYLELLEREGRPLGEKSILATLTSIDKDRFLEEVEPLLVGRMKLVRRTGRGREITSGGHRYLIDMRKTPSGHP